MRRLPFALLLATPVAAIASTAAFIPARSAAPSSVIASAQLQRAATAEWALRDEGKFLRATQMSPANSTTPPFQSVVLRRTLGGATLDCGAFEAPVAIDIGTGRLWSYRIARPKAAACTSGGAAKFLAVGRKNGLETSTSAVP